MTRIKMLVAACVLGLGGSSALLAYGHLESGTLLLTLALTGLASCPLWNWKL